MSDSEIKVLVYTALKEENKRKLREQAPTGLNLLFFDEIAEPARREEFESAVYVYGNPPAEWLMAEGLSLKWMQLYSAGFNEYQGLEKEIAISNLHGFFAQPCAETVVAGILALYRKLDELILLKDRKQWVGGVLRGQMQLLRDKKVLLLGAGTIAMAIHEILNGFHCQVQLYSRTHPQTVCRGKEDLIKIIAETDILINTLPGTAETDKFVSTPMLEAMHPGAVFVNIGRGSTVDEAALIRVLQTQRIGGAVLDVYEEEPLPAASPLWTCANTIISQHTGGGSSEEEWEKADFFLSNLRRVLKGEQPLNLVNLRKGY